MGIVVIGTAFVDIKGFPNDRYSLTGRNAGRVEFFHGGVGRNVVEDIANIELRPSFVSLIDDDYQGRSIIDKLKKHKVNTDYVFPSDGGLGMWLAVFDNCGDLAGSISKRPDQSALAEKLEEYGDEIFRDADSIVLEVDMEKEIVKCVLKFAEKYNKKVYALVSNMNIAMARRDLLQKMACFVCNEEEAGLLFADDFSAESPDDLIDKLADCVANAHIPAVIVTLGGKGSIYANMDGEKGFMPAEKVDVIDTTGAGDCFCAGVAIGLTYGKSLRDSVQIGTRLAASVVTGSENVCARFRPKELGLDIEIDQ